MAAAAAAAGNSLGFTRETEAAVKKPDCLKPPIRGRRGVAEALSREFTGHRVGDLTKKKPQLRNYELETPSLRGSESRKMFIASPGFHAPAIEHIGHSTGSVQAGQPKGLHEPSYWLGRDMELEMEHHARHRSMSSATPARLLNPPATAGGE
ncbi:hypothetical protein TgHK011_009997 [Trichoderma gracile]|nr:hypothetical protein TgHK011_009997 [Trichoderma gracile]